MVTRRARAVSRRAAPRRVRHAARHADSATCGHCSNMDAPNKAHRTSSKGRKAEKKRAQDHKRRGIEPVKSTNWKANLPVFGGNALKRAIRNRDLEQKRLHVPLVDRSDPTSVPPLIVGVVGPPRVGKSTLIRSLVKHYTKYTMGEISGPVTVISGTSACAPVAEIDNAPPGAVAIDHARPPCSHLPAHRCAPGMATLQASIAG